jgi:hypothetical protein
VPQVNRLLRKRVRLDARGPVARGSPLAREWKEFDKHVKTCKLSMEEDRVQLVKWGYVMAPTKPPKTGKDATLLLVHEQRETNALLTRIVGAMERQVSTRTRLACLKLTPFRIPRPAMTTRTTMAMVMAMGMMRMVRWTSKGLTSGRPVVVPCSGLGSVLLGREYDTVFVEIRK